MSENGEEPQSTFAIYLAEGDKLFIEGHYEKALSYYNQALELEEENKAGLVARSRCYLALGDRKAALVDAEASLKDGKSFVKGVYQKAEVLYSMGEFEFALVFYERGHKLRPELEEFRLGLQKAQAAIKNSIGGPEVITLENKGDLSYFKQQESPVKKKKAAKQVGIIQKQERVEKRRSPPLPYGSKQTVRNLLGDLFPDKEYLEDLFHDRDLMDNTRLAIRDLVIDGLEYLDSRTEFWRQQQPIYSRKREKYLRNIKPPNTKPRGPCVRKLHVTKNDNSDYVMLNLEEIEEALNEMRLEEGLKQGESLLNYMTKLDISVLPEKDSLLAALHALLGNLLLSLERYDDAFYHFSADKDKNKSGPGLYRALENMGTVYSKKKEYKQAIAIWNERLEYGNIEANELAWLYYEQGECYFKLEEYKESKEHGEKALRAAEEGDDKQWQLNALVLIAHSLVKIADFKQAMSYYEQAKEISEAIEDNSAREAILLELEQLNRGIVQPVGGLTGTLENLTTSKESKREEKLVTIREGNTPV